LSAGAWGGTGAEFDSEVLCDEPPEYCGLACDPGPLLAGVWPNPTCVRNKIATSTSTRREPNRIAPRRSNFCASTAIDWKFVVLRSSMPGSASKFFRFAKKQYRCKSLHLRLIVNGYKRNYLLPEGRVQPRDVHCVELLPAPDSRLMCVRKQNVNHGTRLRLRRAVYKTRYILLMLS